MVTSRYPQVIDGNGPARIASSGIPPSGCRGKSASSQRNPKSPIWVRVGGNKVSAIHQVGQFSICAGIEPIHTFRIEYGLQHPLRLTHSRSFYSAGK
jgi:hypothetical protein